MAIVSADPASSLIFSITFETLDDSADHISCDADSRTRSQSSNPEPDSLVTPAQTPITKAVRMKIWKVHLHNPKLSQKRL